MYVPVHSAYHEFTGREPVATCVARTKGAPSTFRECLDYIFFHPGPGGRLKLVGVDAVPVIPLTTVSLPTSDQPSDHLKLGAMFDLD